MWRRTGNRVARAAGLCALLATTLGCEVEGGGTLTILALVDGAPARVCFSLEWATTRTVGCTDPQTGEWTESFRGNRAGLLVIDGGDPETEIVYQEEGEAGLLALFPEGVNRALAVRGDEVELVRLDGQSLSGGRVSGRVIVDRDPFGPLQLELHGREVLRASVDASGRFTFSRVRPGSHQLRIAGVDTIPVGFRNPLRTLAINEGEVREEDFLGHRLGTATFRGKMAGRDGTPVSFMPIRLHGLFGGELSATSSFTGDFAFTALPVGEYRLTGEIRASGGYTVWTLGETSSGEGFVFEVEPGDSEITRDVIATRQDTRISGMIGNDRNVDGELSGDEVEEVRVRVVRGSLPDGELVAEIDVHADGTFTTSFLPEGSYTVIPMPLDPDAEMRFVSSLTGPNLGYRTVQTRAGQPIVARGSRQPPRWEYGMSRPLSSSLGPADFVTVFRDGVAAGSVIVPGPTPAGLQFRVVRCAASMGLSSLFPLVDGRCTVASDEERIVTAEADGRFSVPELEEGRWEIYPVAGHGLGTPSPSGYAFEVSGPSARVADLEFRFSVPAPDLPEGTP